MENARGLLDRLSTAFFAILLATFSGTLVLSGTRELLGILSR